MLEPLFEIIETNIDVEYPAGAEAGANTILSTEGIEEIVNFISKNYYKKQN